MKYKFSKGFFGHIILTEDDKWILKISRNGKPLIDTPPCDTFHDAICIAMAAVHFAIAFRLLDSVKEYNREASQ